MLEIIENILNTMSVIKWCGLILLEVALILNIVIATKPRTKTVSFIIFFISFCCLVYLGYIFIDIKPVVLSFLFYYLCIHIGLIILILVVYYTKPKTYSVLNDSGKGYYGQYKTSDYKYTFSVLDPTHKKIAMSCLKYDNIFTFDEIVRQTRNALKSALVEDQTQKFVLRQVYPKFVLFKEGDLYYFDLYINHHVISIESKGYKSYKTALKDICLLQDYGRSSFVVVCKEIIDGNNLADFDDGIKEKQKSLPNKTPRNIKDTKINNDTQLTIYDMLDEPKEEETIPSEANIKIENRKKVQIEKEAELKALEKAAKATGDSKPESLSKSFEAKLYLNTEDNKKYYSDVKNIIMSYEGIYSKISFKHEVFKFDGKMVMKMQIRGSKVAILCPFTKKEYENSKFKFIQVDSFDIHEETPLLYKIYNPLRLKYCEEIIKCVMEKYGITKKVEYTPIDYTTKYHGKDVNDLIDEGEIRRQ